MSTSDEKVKVLVFYAFGREMSRLKKRLEDREPLRIDGLAGVRGRLNGVDIALVPTGIGSLRARQCARKAFKVFTGCALTISGGVAGALSEGLAAGDLVIADRLLLGGKEDSRADHILELPRSEVTETEDALRDAGLSFSTGALLTSSRVLDTADAKRRAKSESGAIAVDMESAGLGLEAAAHGRRFSCVRAVLDEVDDPVPAELADESGRVRPVAATSFFMRHPATILKIPRLMRNLSRATGSLADAIESLTKRV